MFPAALHVFVISRFREAFGSPDSGRLGPGQWSLSPFPGARSIHVVISGEPQQAIWLFDPYTPRNALHRWAIVHLDQVEEAIECVRERLSAAKRWPAGWPMDAAVPANSDPMSGALANGMPASADARGQYWNLGAIALLRAVQSSRLSALGERAAASCTSRRQRSVRAAVVHVRKGAPGDSKSRTGSPPARPGDAPGRDLL